MDNSIDNIELFDDADGLVERYGKMVRSFRPEIGDAALRELLVGEQNRQLKLALTRARTDLVIERGRRERAGRGA